MSRRSAARNVVAVLGATTATLWMPASVASADEDLPPASISTTEVGVGESFTLSGTGCLDLNTSQRTSVGVASPGTSLLVGAWTDEGDWSLTVSLGDAGPGTYEIRINCHVAEGRRVYPRIMVTVVGPVEAPPDVQPAPAASATPRPRVPQTPATSESAAPASTEPVPVATAVLPPAPADGCADCARLAGEEPLRAGSRLTLSYAGFAPGEQVAVVMRSRPVELGVFTADASGVVTAVVTLPPSAEAGSHTLTLTGPVTGDLVVPFTLTGPAGATATATAPVSTGASGAVPLAAATAFVLVAAGAGVLLRRRSRARRAAAAVPREAQLTATPIAEPIA